jgi:hypothetical protein
MGRMPGVRDRLTFGGGRRVEMPVVIVEAKSGPDLDD